MNAYEADLIYQNATRPAVPANPMIDRAAERRTREGLRVMMVKPNGEPWTGYFGTTESRDEFIARAEAAGCEILEK